MEDICSACCTVSTLSILEHQELEMVPVTDNVTVNDECLGGKGGPPLKICQIFLDFQKAFQDLTTFFRGTTFSSQALIIDACIVSNNGMVRIIKMILASSLLAMGTDNGGLL